MMTGEEITYLLHVCCRLKTIQIVGVFAQAKTL
jgi:hypothetical protein